MKITAFDLESHLFQPGLPTPPHVCGSVAEEIEGRIVGRLLDKQAALDWYRENVGKVLMIGANIQFDNSLMVVADGSFDLLCRVFKAYEEGLFSDVQIREMLNHIGHGWVQDLLIDPHTGGVLMDPGTGKKAGRMSLATVLYCTLKRTDAKKNADWRKKYALLEHVPLADWPIEARQYPVDDVENTFKAWIAQRMRPDGMNLHNEARQLRAAWAIRLASIHGLRTDPVRIAEVSARIEAKLDKKLATYREIGFRREDDSENTRVVKRAVAQAYGDTSPCDECGSAGQVLAPPEKQPKRATTARKYVTCKSCQGTGIKLEICPLTEKGGVKTDRDTLEESGAELLENYAWVSNDEKFKNTYLPYLRKASNVPINPEGNVLVNTGRTSYDGVIQLIPRGGGLRECFVPRVGSVYCSIDYAALELSTLAQVLIWTVGWSQMGDAINDGQDLHVKFGASMVGESYDVFRAGVKAGDKKLKGYRQAAKAANFGFPGGMGPAKLVWTKRKEGLRFCITLGEAPPCDCGGSAYCRKCHGRGALCGLEMVREWNGNPCPPVCKRCVELASQLKAQWLKQWPEINHYFRYIKKMIDGQGSLEQFVSRRVRGGLDFCNGANTLFQGLAADGAKHALWLVSKECYTDRDSKMFGARPVIFVHDEIFSEIRREIASQAADRMVTVMVDGMSEFVPDVRVSAEPTLMDRWYKEAECRRGPDKQLLVWSPDKKHYDPKTGTVYEDKK